MCFTKNTMNDAWILSIMQPWFGQQTDIGK